MVQEHSKQSFCLLQLQANSSTYKILRLSKLNYQLYKKCLKGPVAVRTQIFKTSTADLISTDPQLLQCIATDDYCIYKQKQILQVKKVRIYWYHMRICNKMSSIKKPKKIQAQKVQSGVLEQRHDWLTKFLLTPLQILVCKLRHLLETKH